MQTVLELIMEHFSYMKAFDYMLNDESWSSAMSVIAQKMREVLLGIHPFHSEQPNF